MCQGCVAAARVPALSVALRSFLSFADSGPVVLEAGEENADAVREGADADGNSAN
jgi:hypothetical protein